MTINITYQYHFSVQKEKVLEQVSNWQIQVFQQDLTLEPLIRKSETLICWKFYAYFWHLKRRFNRQDKWSISHFATIVSLSWSRVNHADTDTCYFSELSSLFSYSLFIDEKESLPIRVLLLLPLLLSLLLTLNRYWHPISLWTSHQQQNTIVFWS